MPVIASDSEAIQLHRAKHWIASAPRRLAMTDMMSSAEHVPVHLAVVEMEERYRCVVAQRAGGQTPLQFAQDILCHLMQIGERLGAELNPDQLDKLGFGMDH